MHSVRHQIQIMQADAEPWYTNISNICYTISRGFGHYCLKEVNYSIVIMRIKKLYNMYIL
jgi:hypothetical protein